MNQPTNSRPIPSSPSPMTRRELRATERNSPVRTAISRARATGATLRQRVLRAALPTCASAILLMFVLVSALPPRGLQAAIAVPATAPPTEVQQLEVSAAAPSEPVVRDSFSVTSYAEMLRLRYSRLSLSYSTNWTGPIRWPFPTAVPITDGFGQRPVRCPGCSTYHTALDFDAGAGAPIYAIADGVVREHVDGWGSWGNYVIIEHQIDGQTVLSSYAHMQRGSSPLVAGETVRVGDFIGLVGATGQVTGAHLHFELDVDGQKVDPFAWLSQNAG